MINKHKGLETKAEQDGLKNGFDLFYCDRCDNYFAAWDGANCCTYCGKSDKMDLVDTKD